MGCVHFNTKNIIVNSIESFKRETEKKLKTINVEDYKNKIFTFADYQYEENSNSLYSNEKQSKIFFNGSIEKNEIIFV